MVAEPVATPVTTPVALTVATAGLLLLQVPPTAGSVSVDIAPVQTEIDEGLITPDAGEALMVIAVVEVAVPQPVVDVYVIVAEPALTPVTTPEASTVATAVLLLLHVPPEAVLDNVEVVPEQKVVVPEIEPASGATLTVTGDDTVAVPQMLLTA
jgi:hypothetical protein